MRKFEKVWEGLRKFEKAWKSLREFEKVWKSLRKFEKVWKFESLKVFFAKLQSCEAVVPEISEILEVF